MKPARYRSTVERARFASRKLKRGVKLLKCENFWFLCSFDFVSFKKKERLGSRFCTSGFPNASAVEIGYRIVKSVGAFDESCHERPPYSKKC